MAAAPTAICQDARGNCASPGLVGLAEAALQTLEACHVQAASIDDAVTPPVPVSGGDPSPPQLRPQDLTTLLRDINEAASSLRSKLTGVREALRG